MRGSSRPKIIAAITLLIIVVLIWIVATANNRSGTNKDAPVFLREVFPRVKIQKENDHYLIYSVRYYAEQIAIGDELLSLIVENYQDQESIYLRLGRDGSPNLTVSNSDTAQEVVTNNPRRDWTSLPPDPDYTAQFILASSYGLMQTLFETARWNGFERASSPARHVENLFTPSVNVGVGVRTLKFYYDKSVVDHPTWSYEQNIKQALLDYNGGGNPSYPTDVYDMYISHTYDQI